jgi:hypothetical protein
MLEWRHPQENCWFNLQSTSVYLPHKHKCNKLLHLHSYNTTLVHKLCDTNHIARVNSVNWYLHAEHNGEINPTAVVFNDGDFWMYSFLMACWIFSLFKITAYNIILNTLFPITFKKVMITMLCYHSIRFSTKKLTLG